MLSYRRKSVSTFVPATTKMDSGSWAGMTRLKERIQACGYFFG